MKPIKGVPLLPFITYARADSGDLYTNREQREWETRSRHWCMVWWLDEDGKRKTAEVMVITESMPDFCGGIIVYSPRVDIYSEANSWVRYFCNPGATPPGGPGVEWSDFKEDMAIDLVKFTGRKKWTDDQVRTYGLQSIVGQICADMLYHNKRGCMGADYVGGRMTELFKLAGMMGEITPPRFQCNVEITNNMTSRSFRPYDGTVLKCFLRARFDDEWYNTNSGNTVHWITANLEGSNPTEVGMGECWNCGHYFNIYQYGECPNCEEYNDWDAEEDAGFDTNEYALPDDVKEVMANPEYLMRARRYFWRNG